MKRVFISHPYKSNPEKNMKKVDEICKKVIDEGDDVLPISPLHLFSFFEVEEAYREEIMDTCYDMIKDCDEVWVYGTSDGCVKEIMYADLLDKKVVKKF